MNICFKKTREFSGQGCTEIVSMFKIWIKIEGGELKLKLQYIKMTNTQNIDQEKIRTGGIKALRNGIKLK